ncbi:MAG: hypothetical protein AAGF84_08725 [Planctomycetota bacterium]
MRRRWIIDAFAGGLILIWVVFTLIDGGVYYFKTQPRDVGFGFGEINNNLNVNWWDTQFAPLSSKREGWVFLEREPLGMAWGPPGGYGSKLGDVIPKVSRWTESPGGRTYAVDVSISTIYLPVISMLLIGCRLWRGRFQGKPGLCAACRYDLTGCVSGACPECGMRFQAAETDADADGK